MPAVIRDQHTEIMGDSSALITKMEVCIRAGSQVGFFDNRPVLTRYPTE